MRCKGAARAIDQVAMQAELRQLDRKVTKLTMKMAEAHLITQEKMQQPVEVANPAEFLKVFRLPSKSQMHFNEPAV